MKRPVTVVTGFLGSGKTTLLARVLADPSMRNTAVLVNEFGEVGLDHHLLRRVDEKTVLLGGGCVCCATRDDLVGALGELLGFDQRGEVPPLERVVIETTGLADPAPILFTIFSDAVLQHHFSVDLVLCAVDAVNGDLHLDRNPESVKQVAASDKLLLTKSDLSEPGRVEALTSRLRSINPSAPVTEVSFGEIPASDLFHPGVSADGARRETPEPDPRPHGSYGTEGIAQTSTVSVTFDGPVDWTAFGVWLSMLLNARGEDVLRVKGLLDVGESGPVVLNGVQHIIHPPKHLEEWPSGDHRSRVVFIARGVSGEDLLASLSAFEPVLGAGPVIAVP